jgi:hypothetical protein
MIFLYLWITWIFIMALWTLFVAQVAYRNTENLNSRVKKLEEERNQEEESYFFCSACTREIEDDEKVEIQIDLPMNPESTVLLPVTIELCKECASIGKSD